MRNIKDFKNGDKITRVKPLMEVDGYKNFSYVGSELTFLGIENATIYLKRKPVEVTENPFSLIFGGNPNKPIIIPFDLWEDGWDYYKEPDFLNTNEISLEEKSINNEIQKAIKEEKFEVAAELMKKLKNIL